MFLNFYRTKIEFHDSKIIFPLLALVIVYWSYFVEVNVINMTASCFNNFEILSKKITFVSVYLKFTLPISYKIQIGHHFPRSK